MRLTGALAATLLVAGCATPQQPARTQLQVREIQTRTFDTADVKLVVKGVINVLQDDDYIVKNANLELGLVSATKEANVSSGTEKFFAFLFLGRDARYKQNSIIECSANVSQLGDRIRVRANFQLKVLDNAGAAIEVRTIDDEKFYQEFFAKVDKGLFLEKEKL